MAFHVMELLHQALHIKDGEKKEVQFIEGLPWKGSSIHFKVKHWE